MSTERVLKQYWGFESLRPLQQEAIDATLQGRDAVVVMPTGGGKSLCFQMPPLLDGQLTVVVSPLISLMKDQLDALELLGYPAASLHSNLSTSEVDAARAGVANGTIKLLYTSPERVLTPAFLALMRQANVARFAIDEAHCISQWGHDFRPEYRQLAKLRELFPNAPIQALTATATPRVREDIAQQLNLRETEFLVGIFDRPNLTYRVVPKQDPIRQIAEAINRHPEDAAIVYCISRKDTDKTAEALISSGINAAAYHAGLDANRRKEISEAFAQERVNVVVATVAFGMGIDRSNVRCVIHESLPKSIEAYQQETGRAGRDGMPSECLMLYAPNDYLRWERLIQESSSGDQLLQQLGMVDEVRRYANGTKCRHAYLSEYFGQTYAQENCDACDLCLEGWQQVENSAKRAHQIIATVLAIEEATPRMGFGARHVAEVLTGSGRKNVLQYGHHQLKAYGAISDKSADQVAAWVGQMVDLGFLARTTGKFSTVSVTPAGREALRSRLEILLRDVAMPTRRRRAETPAGFDEPLFEALRMKRRELAAEREVPAYVIFHDAVLVEMSRRRPTTVEALSAISGVGEKRGRELGPVFLEVILEQARARGLSTDVSTAPIVEAPVPLTASAAKLRPLFRSGMPLNEICEKVGLAMSTVEGYLHTWVQEERPERVDAWVDESTYARVARAIDEHGAVRLRPIYEALDGEVPYPSIRVVVAHYQAQVAPLST